MRHDCGNSVGEVPVQVLLKGEQYMEMIKMVSAYAVPVIFTGIICFGLYREVNVFEAFADGAAEGISTIVRIIPPLVGLFVAVGVFRASGALDLFIYLVNPLFSMAGIPSETLTLALVRPVSGSASLAVVADIMKTHGPDSFIGRVACTIMGSTETIFYTIAVYFGAAGVKRIRYTLAAALIADAVALIAAVWACRVAFGA